MHESGQAPSLVGNNIQAISRIHRETPPFTQCNLTRDCYVQWRTRLKDEGVSNVDRFYHRNGDVDHGGGHGGGEGGPAWGWGGGGWVWQGRGRIYPSL